MYESMRVLLFPLLCVLQGFVLGRWRVFTFYCRAWPDVSQGTLHCQHLLVRLTRVRDQEMSLTASSPALTTVCWIMPTVCASDGMVCSLFSNHCFVSRANQSHKTNQFTASTIRKKWISTNLFFVHSPISRPCNIFLVARPFIFYITANM